MKLLFAFGNPGTQYQNTRHNTGYWLADSIASNHHTKFIDKPKFKCLLAEIQMASTKLIIAKPTTFYNLVGESLVQIANYYSIDQTDILAVHDDLALTLGTVRVRTGGSAAGNNGVKSINQYGFTNTQRLRIGISTEDKGQIADSDYVLGKFTKAEQEKLDDLLPELLELVDKFTDQRLNPTTLNTIHRA